jgi:glycosyltransferase involved in cell wall biosynthesis
MKRVLWISNYGYPNSYAHVTKYLLKRYLEKYPDKVDLYFFAVGRTYENGLLDKVKEDIPLPDDHIIFTILDGKDFKLPEDNEYVKNLILGVHHFQYVKDYVKPDLIISLNDMAPIVYQLMIANRLDFDIIPYVPCDIDHMEKDGELTKRQFRALITPSEHSKQDMQKHFDCPIHVLPHLINTKFHPLKNKKELKKKWLGGENFFVVIVSNSNNVRKRLDLSVNAFLRFAEGKDNVRLLLKSNEPEKDTRYGSISISEYDLKEFQHPKIKIVSGYLSEEELNEFYNCGDVGLTTTSGEGFGLIPCEMTLCDVPQIVPNNTSHPWLFGKDYSGMIPCDQYAYCVARSLAPLEDIQKESICILKVYSHYDEEAEISEEHTPLKMSPEIPTIVLTPHPNAKTGKGIIVCRTAEEVIEMITKSPNATRLQVLLNTNIAFMKGLNLDRLFAARWANRKSYIINEIVIQSYLYKQGTTGLPRLAPTVQLLERCYKDKSFRRLLLDQCQERMRKLLDHDAIIDKLLEIFEEL